MIEQAASFAGASRVAGEVGLFNNTDGKRSLHVPGGDTGFAPTFNHGQRSYQCQFVGVHRVLLAICLVVFDKASV